MLKGTKVVVRLRPKMLICQVGLAQGRRCSGNGFRLLATNQMYQHNCRLWRLQEETLFLVLILKFTIKWIPSAGFRSLS